jgi:AcrR family transcriptional regulator
VSEVKASPLPLRKRQALETRRAIARAARFKFASSGYASTTIEAVAKEAGVAARTVYSIFGTKKAILGAICEEWLAEAGVMESATEGMRERDLGRRLAIVAHASRRQWESERGVRGMLEGAAASDPDVASMVAGWKNDRAASLHSVVAGLEKELRPGLDTKRAGAIIRAMSSAEIYGELVAGEGWLPDEYEIWLTEVLRELLLAKP